MLKTILGAEDVTVNNKSKKKEAKTLAFMELKFQRRERGNTLNK